MKLVFAGTPDFAAAALDALHRAGHETALVLTQPDRPSGRGLHPTPSAVKRLAQTLDRPVLQPATLKDPAIQTTLASLRPDAMIVAAYGLIVPQAVLDIPRRGCINIHASLLPRWRGAAPIQRAILAGDHKTGISIMQMDAGLDTGPVLLEETTDIARDDTAQTLHDRLAAMGARLIVEALDHEPIEGRVPQPQDGTRATYAAKLDKRDATIDWSEPAAAIARKVRAFNPVPGASTTYGGSALKLWHARAREHAGAAAPGTIISADKEGVLVACGGDSALEVTELQRAGGKRLPASSFLAGSPLHAGDRLGA
jgi:methionyl-tRNA formyltransferase